MWRDESFWSGMVCVWYLKLLSIVFSDIGDCNRRIFLFLIGKVIKEGYYFCFGLGVRIEGYFCL